jgi:oligoendopeptidase F
VSAALASANTPEAVYRTLIEEAHAGLPTLQRYLRIRSKVLGLSQAGYQDTYAPLAEPPRSFTVGEAEELTLEALKPLGSAYTDKLAANFQAAWMHAVPARGKRSGAYMNDAAYDVHPYVLLSFNGNYNSVSTLAHEWGHAMHSVYAAGAQPFETAGYRIFVAEIPSTANELLLADHVASTAQTRDEKIFALSEELELLRATFFRQAMFAEFELKSHEAVERGEPLTGQKLSAMYLDLLRQYHGDAEGVMKIDDLYGVEWAYIPHFYNDFYVFQYATCVAAAAYFVDGIEKGDVAMRDRYFAMLSAGSSDDAYAIVKKAGPDLATPAPYRALVARMNRAMDQLELLLAQNP